MNSDPLVMIPPMMCDARVWSYQIADLSPDTAIIVPPLACGERMEEIASRIMGWCPKRFALLGAGMGGAVALEIMRRAPERITRIALMSTSFQGETPEGASKREPLIVAARSGRFGDVIKKELDPACLAAGANRLTVSQYFEDMAKSLGPEAYVSQARAMQRRPDQQRTLRKITQPAIVIGGEEDTLMPAKRHEFLAEFIPNAALHMIPDAGHLPMLEQPDRVTAILRDWLRSPLVLR